MEYEAKELLRRSGVPTPKGVLATEFDKNPWFPCILKSQVPIGGRGKAGGIKIAHNKSEYLTTIDQLYRLEISGFKPNTIWCEELIDISRECYISFIINRETNSIEVLAYPIGGMDIESYHRTDFFQEAYRPDSSFVDRLADFLDIPDKAFILQDILHNLYECFTKEDTTLLEINPLILTKEGKLIAGDCKMELDNAAAFRHSDWNFEAPLVSANFVTLNQNGTIATIANGAGLAMATVDAVAAAGYTPANFLDVGGNTSPEKILESLTTISSLCDVKAIVINIFGGIVRCDDVARAIVLAKKSLPNLPPLYIRLNGNRSKEAVELLEKNHLSIHTSLGASLLQLKKDIIS